MGFEATFRCLQERRELDKTHAQIRELEEKIVELDEEEQRPEREGGGGTVRFYTLQEGVCFSGEAVSFGRF